MTRGARAPRLEVGFAAHLFFDHMQTPSEEIETRLAEVEPDVDVLAVDQIAAERLRIVIDREGGVDLALCERVTRHLRDLLVDYALEVSSPGPERPLTKPEHYRQLPRSSRTRAHARAARRPQELHRRAGRGLRRRGHRRSGRRGGVDPVRRDQPQQPVGGRGMSKEIVEAVQVLEREKGIAADRLMEALEDALLSAYKKTPEAAKYAPRRRRPRHRRLPGLRAAPAAGPRGAAARRGRGGARRARGRPGDGRAQGPRGARDQPGAARGVQRSDRGARRRHPTTSAASPPRPPSR